MRVYLTVSDRLSKVYTPKSGLRGEKRGRERTGGMGDAVELMFNEASLRGERSLADATNGGRGPVSAGSGVLAFVTLIA